MTALPSLIQDALHTQLKTPDLTTPATDIAWPFIPYTPVVRKSYFDVRQLMTAAPNHPTIGFTDPTMERGIFQVDAVIPDGNGEAPGWRLAELVKARFALGTKLALGSFYLRINSPPQTANPLKETGWIRFPVSVPYLIIA